MNTYGARALRRRNRHSSSDEDKETRRKIKEIQNERRNGLMENFLRNGLTCSNDLDDYNDYLLDDIRFPDKFGQTYDDKEIHPKKWERAESNTYDGNIPIGFNPANICNSPWRHWSYTIKELRSAVENHNKFIRGVRRAFFIPDFDDIAWCLSGCLLTELQEQKDANGIITRYGWNDEKRKAYRKHKHSRKKDYENMLAEIGLFGEYSDDGFFMFGIRRDGALVKAKTDVPERTPANFFVETDVPLRTLANATTTEAKEFKFKYKDENVFLTVLTQEEIDGTKPKPDWYSDSMEDCRRLDYEVVLEYSEIKSFMGKNVDAISNKHLIKELKKVNTKDTDVAWGLLASSFFSDVWTEECKQALQRHNDKHCIMKWYPEGNKDDYFNYGIRISDGALVRAVVSKQKFVFENSTFRKKGNLKIEVLKETETASAPSEPAKELGYRLRF